MAKMMNEQDAAMMGSGIIPTMVMQDLDLTIEAKSIYAYIAAHAEFGDTVLLPVEDICQGLKIGKDRFHRHKRMLLEKGYITIEQVIEKGRYHHNRYILNSKVPV